MTPRQQIIRNYAAWTATAALRSGKHIKDGKTLQKALELVVRLDEIPETEVKFDAWHRRTTEQLCEEVIKIQNEKIAPKDLDLTIGWSAKLLNIYLKTLYYVGDLQPSDLRKVIHPPIDNILIDCIHTEYGVDVWGSKKSFSIQGLTNYEQYFEIIKTIKEIKLEVGFDNLIDIEQAWTSIEKKSSQKEKYLLHEAMVKALEAMPNNEGTFEEIANYINTHMYYTQKNGQDVPAFQIKLRGILSKGRHHDKFEKVGEEGIRLKK